ncbi:fused response regulator/phosphatase [Amantichitinum ursilacus]|uniref:Alkaline phosphatase synthesis transcriptional regulatory protein PhoP n=1 Tax=Amantichitinum ursilacus TaxID=857265 RepID=A0A0N1JSU9_9NEIS|nr:fused response regulator/phosphatase [Amantichitinum ursilacus]KPC53110.1 Alkaline phosphatase synthesis transcriptional regulatory protein PhoP [Amantichitinum ursilacus]
MKILVVDDTEAVLLLISRFVEALGHTAIQARDGAQAVALWRQAQPDLVLMDMMMPVMSGPEAAVAIKQEAGESWVPIVFVTGVGEENRLAEAIERGADDYISKPVNFRVLEAKLKAFNRTLELNRKVREQSIKLASYYDRAEEEKRVVQHLMDQMVNAERLYDPLLDYWLSPAESLSGDLIAAARTPGQVLYVMLADGIGHGLTAALNVLPLTQPFYSMTEKGYTLSDILVEMNNKVRQVLPVGRFVATVLIAIDEVAGCVEIWNGGMPTVQLLNRAGDVVTHWRSAHLPLGIVPTQSMETATERYYYSEPGTLVAYSDGLIEARAPDGEAFSEGRLLQLLHDTPGPDRLEHFKNTLADHLAGESHHDDISLVMIRFGERAALAAPQRNPHTDDVDIQALVGSGDSMWRYTLSLGAEELRYINTVPFMMTFVNEIKALVNSQSDVFLILTELFVNALDHGLLNMDSALKQGEQGMERYLLERASRLADLKQGVIEIDLAGLRINGRDVLRIRLKDTGAGFDYSRHTELVPGDMRSAHGRGILLVRSMCASLQFLGSGNEVVAHYIPAVNA